MTTNIAQQKEQAIWSLSDLKQLAPDQIMDRIEQIDNQAMLYKWRLYWALRQKFPSNIEFGHYLAALRERPHSAFNDSQPVINRYLQAGRFCEQHKIGSLEQAGVKPSVIYLLSQPKNKDIADAIFTQIRRKNILHKDVQVMLEQTKSVATIEHQPEPQEQDYIEGEVIPNEQFTPIFTQEAPAVAPNQAVAEQAVSRLMQSIIEDEEDKRLEVIPIYDRRIELIKEFSASDNIDLSDDQVLEIYRLIDTSLGRNGLKLAELHNNRKNIIIDEIYKK